MSLFRTASIATKVLSGFGVILLLLIVISMVSILSLSEVNRYFKDYQLLVTMKQAEYDALMLDKLDAIGPEAANEVERLILAVRSEQDALGVLAEAKLAETVKIVMIISIVSIFFSLLAVWFAGFGVSRQIRTITKNTTKNMTNTVKELADGNMAIDFEADSQAKNAFLTNMNHELRTPMNAILGYSEMLIESAEDLKPEEFVPDLKKINLAGTHLLALINDVLDLSKVDSGQMEALAEEFNLNNLIAEVADTAQPMMETNSNKILIERGEHLGSALQDRTKLRRTLLNLLSNAARFTHEGVVTLTVRRTSQIDGDWLIFAVSDSGIGIAEDKLESVFKEFMQVDGSTTRKYDGTGLGLAISWRFCKLLGGDLSVHSELEKGSTFTIQIPATLPPLS